jgi:protein TonB
LEAPAERITFVPPVYPRTSKWYGLTGHVTLAVVVRPDGTVANRPRVVAALPSGRGFEEAAVDAVKKWRFSPATREGKAVESNLTIGVNFE